MAPRLDPTRSAWTMAWASEHLQLQGLRKRTRGFARRRCDALVRPSDLARRRPGRGRAAELQGFCRPDHGRFSVSYFAFLFTIAVYDGFTCLLGRLDVHATRTGVLPTSDTPFRLQGRTRREREPPHPEYVLFGRSGLARVVRGRVFPLASWGRMRMSARLFILLVRISRGFTVSIPYRHETHETRSNRERRGRTLCQNAGNRDTKPHYSRHPRCGRKDTCRERQTLGSYAATCEAVPPPGPPRPPVAAARRPTGPRAELRAAWRRRPRRRSCRPRGRRSAW